MDKRTPLSLLEKRRSVRTFLNEPLSEKAVKKIKAEIQDINSHESGFHFQLIENDPNPFAGFSRSYGSFKNARHYVACAIEEEYPDALERAGFFAEQIAILATEMKLGTCFVGGTFSRAHSAAQMRASWSLPFILLIGVENEDSKGTFLSRMTHSLLHRKTCKWEDFYVSESIGLRDALKYNDELEVVLKAVACAPSSLNKRPVRVRLNKDTKEIELFTTTKDSKTSIDLGIAKFNACAAGALWPEWGNNSPLPSLND